MNIHELIAEKVDLATTYADDGAFHSAARIFGQLMVDLQRHAMASDNFGGLTPPADGSRESRLMVVDLLALLVTAPAMTPIRAGIGIDVEFDEIAEDDSKVAALRAIFIERAGMQP